MKLGATITSERGKPVTKTGNEYLEIDIKDDNHQVIAEMRVYIKNDSVGEYPDIIIKWADHVYINGQHGLDAEITTNGSLKHGKYKIRCNNCMQKFTDEQQLASIDDMEACPECKTDAYLMDL